MWCESRQRLYHHYHTNQVGSLVDTWKEHHPMWKMFKFLLVIQMVFKEPFIQRLNTYGDFVFGAALTHNDTYRVRLNPFIVFSTLGKRGASPYALYSNCYCYYLLFFFSLCIFNGKAHFTYSNDDASTWAGKHIIFNVMTSNTWMIEKHFMS